MIQLNVDAALRSLGNNKKLYKKVIDKFIAAYEQAGEQLSQHVEKQETEEAKRLAHTIKGLAGSLGADELAQASAAVETALKSGTPASDVAPLVAAFTTVLTDTIIACAATSSQME